VAILWYADDPALALALREMRAAAQLLQLEFRSLGTLEDMKPVDFWYANGGEPRKLVGTMLHALTELKKSNWK
jgi:hypothetical protein